MATNLYRLLGKKTTTSDKNFYDNKKLSENESKENIFSEDVMDYSQNQILELDKNFDFYAFLKGAKEAFKVIVESFKNNKLEEVKYLINDDVYEKFDKALNKDNKNAKFFKITALKASILNIEVLHKCANIKVEFFSNQEEKTRISGKLKM